jgi:hypothetical protein
MSAFCFSTHLSLYLSTHLTVYLSIYQSVYQFICLGPRELTEANRLTVNLYFYNFHTVLYFIKRQSKTRLHLPEFGRTKP